MNSPVKRVLIVEDDKLALMALTRLLRQQGFYVDGCVSVSAAMHFLDTEPFYCCIFLDLMLPDGDGCDVLRRIKKDPKKKNTAVAVMTGCTDRRRETAASLLPDMLMTKPVKMDQLSEFISVLPATPDSQSCRPVSPAQILSLLSPSRLQIEPGSLFESFRKPLSGGL